jgi:hypothetical protein
MEAVGIEPAEGFPRYFFCPGGQAGDISAPGFGVSRRCSLPSAFMT